MYADSMTAGLRHHAGGIAPERDGMGVNSHRVEMAQRCCLPASLG